MKFGEIFHLGIVVRDLDKAVEIYEKELGYGPFEMGDGAFFEDKIVNGRTGGGLPMRTATYRSGTYEIELIEPTGPSVYMDHLKEKGPGVHHVILKNNERYEDILAMAERVSGRPPRLETKFPDGTPIVSYVDLEEECGLLLETGMDAGEHEDVCGGQTGDGAEASAADRPHGISGDTSGANRPFEIPDDGVQAANPYLPLWERIPDGEPRIFHDPWSGEDRLYVYGSHESTGFACGPEHVVWSAPLHELTKWRYEGLAIKTADLEGIPYVDADGQKKTLHVSDKHVLYAPDVVYNPTTGKYTMAGFLAEDDPASFMFIATSDTPGGPFTDPYFIGWGFDPAVLVDDVRDKDGHQRMYLYWSVEANRSGWAAELDPVNVTILEGTIHGPRAGETVEGINTMFSQKDAPYYFFEGPSIRKIEGTYVLSYARSAPSDTIPVGALAEIAYAVSDNPFGDPALGSEWEYGGVIIDNRGELVSDPYDAGKSTYTWFGLNNHGGLVRVGDDWYQIYHRGTNKQFKRQSMAVKVHLWIDEAGKLRIDQAEYTSEGFHTEGLDPYKRLYAASACYALPVSDGDWMNVTGPVITSNDENDFDVESVRDNWYGVGNLKNRTWLGYKYYNFENGIPAEDTLKLRLTLKEFAPGSVHIYAADARKSPADPEQPKTRIGTIPLSGENSGIHTVEGEITGRGVLAGKKAVYLEFLTEEEGSMAEINELVFIRERRA